MLVFDSVVLTVGRRGFHNLGIAGLRSCFQYPNRSKSSKLKSREDMAFSPRWRTHEYRTHREFVPRCSHDTPKSRRTADGLEIEKCAQLLKQKFAEKALTPHNRPKTAC